MKYDPRKHGARCDLCPRKGQVPVPPIGPKRADICWLGQDPSKREVVELTPFIGPTGKKLMALWERACAAVQVALPRKLVWVTNAALCLPLTKSAAEGKRAVDCCAPRLQRELRALHPSAAILPMGKWAFYALTGKVKGVAKFQGFYNELKQLPAVPVVKPKKEKKK